jgi:hypothetical protein
MKPKWSVASLAVSSRCLLEVTWLGPYWVAMSLRHEYEHVWNCYTQWEPSSLLHSCIVTYELEKMKCTSILLKSLIWATFVMQQGDSGFLRPNSHVLTFWDSIFWLTALTIFISVLSQYLVDAINVSCQIQSLVSLYEFQIKLYKPENAFSWVH